MISQSIFVSWRVSAKKIDPTKHLFQLGKLKLHEIESDDKLELEVFEKEKLDEVDKEDEQYAITVLEEKKNQMKPNMAAIAEYKKKVRL